IRQFASERGLRLLARDLFVERVFFPVVCDRRGLLIGANLPFDISRLAIGHGAAKDRTGVIRGGFSFTLSPDERRARVQVKRVGARATLIRLTIPDGRHAEARNRERGGNMLPHRGYFIDVLTLGAALLGSSYSLKDLADTLDTETRKLDVDEHGGPL